FSKSCMPGDFFNSLNHKRKISGHVLVFCYCSALLWAMPQLRRVCPQSYQQALWTTQHVFLKLSLNCLEEPGPGADTGNAF
ncbi:MAG: hypothetical protein ACI83P_002558, partial [Janthinobacterium sp.]